MGHRHLGVITGPVHLPNAVERLKGFKRAIAEAKLTVQPEYIQEARFNRDSGYEAAMRLLRMLPRPTAIFACNDLMDIGRPAGGTRIVTALSGGFVGGWV